ncbi:MAG: biopolymer transporter ExbD [Myxococcales bacterium]|nr:biopolymer transporter ExbD [Myxococcales bacterium]
MASISTGGDGHGSKKSVDAEIPLIPFIDLLLCCVMFLLVTAVWNKLSSLEGHLDAPGNPQSTIDQPNPEDLPLTVRIDHDGYQLSTGLGDETRIPLAAEGSWDLAALSEHLRERHRIAPNDERVIVTADDGVEYSQMVAALDVFAGTGYSAVTVSGGF